MCNYYFLKGSIITGGVRLSTCGPYPANSQLSGVVAVLPRVNKNLPPGKA
jgi:hypothetical protein